MRVNTISRSSIFEQGCLPVHVERFIHNGTVETHTHNFYEFVYVIDGFTLHTYNGQTTILTAGDMFAMRPGDIHSYVGAHDNVVYNCLFCREALEGFFNEVMDLPAMRSVFGDGGPLAWKRVHLAPAEQQKVISQLAEMSEECLAKRQGWELKVKAQLLGFLVNISRYYTNHYPGAEENKCYLGYIRRSLEFIGEHYAEDISISDVAVYGGISPDYLTRQFKQVLGITPVEYLRNFRFARAMELIKIEGSKVGQVAGMVGYNHFSHFTREFKSLFGITPSDYKKRAAGESHGS